MADIDPIPAAVPENAEKPENTEQLQGSAPVGSGIAKAITDQALRMGVSGILGYCSGYFTQKLAQKTAYYAGASFMGLQWLVYKDWIEIKWDNVTNDFCEGVKPKDGQGLVNQAAKIVTYKIPKAAAFSTGFYYGWKRYGLEN